MKVSEEVVEFLTELVTNVPEGTEEATVEETKAREAERAGIPAPLHTAMYRLIKGKEAAWHFQEENKPVTVH